MKRPRTNLWNQFGTVETMIVDNAGSEVVSQAVDESNTTSIQPFVITPSLDTDEAASAFVSGQDGWPNVNFTCPGNAENEVAATDSATEWSTDTNVIVIKPEPGTESGRKSAGNGKNDNGNYYNGGQICPISLASSQIYVVFFRQGFSLVLDRALVQEARLK